MNPFKGDWRIIEMEMWDQEDFDLDGPAFFHFELPHNKAFAKLHFLVVDGVMDCQYSQRDGKPFVEFSWLGSDEGDEVSGRGWAAIGTDGILVGRIFFHQGDHSGFKAQRSLNRLMPPPKQKNKRLAR